MIFKGNEFFIKSTIAKFRLTVTSLMVQTSNLANMTRNYAMLHYKFDKVRRSILEGTAFLIKSFVIFICRIFSSFMGGGVYP